MTGTGYSPLPAVPSTMDEASRTYLADLVREIQKNMKADLRDTQKDMIDKMQVMVDDTVKKATAIVFKALREEIRNPGGKEVCDYSTHMG